MANRRANHHLADTEQWCQSLRVVSVESYHSFLVLRKISGSDSLHQPFSRLSERLQCHLSDQIGLLCLDSTNLSVRGCCGNDVGVTNYGPSPRSPNSHSVKSWAVNLFQCLSTDCHALPMTLDLKKFSMRGHKEII